MSVTESFIILILRRPYCEVLLCDTVFETDGKEAICLKHGVELLMNGQTQRTTDHLWPYKVTVSWWSNDMALVQNARDWGSIRHWGPKLLTHCDFDVIFEVEVCSKHDNSFLLGGWSGLWVLAFLWCDTHWNTRDHGSIPRSGSKLLTHCDIKRVLQIPWTCFLVLCGFFLKKW